MQREHRILNWWGKAHSPTPPLYTIDKALYSGRGALDGLNTSLLELAPIPTPTPTTAIPLPVLAIN